MTRKACRSLIEINGCISSLKKEIRYSISDEFEQRGFCPDNLEITSITFIVTIAGCPPDR
jgi:hypothetical protein